MTLNLLFGFTFLALAKRANAACVTKSTMCEFASEAQCRSSTYMALWGVAGTPASSICKWDGFWGCVTKPTMCEFANEAQCQSSAYMAVWKVANTPASKYCEWTPGFFGAVNWEPNAQKVSSLVQKNVVVSRHAHPLGHTEQLLSECWISQGSSRMHIKGDSYRAGHQYGGLIFWAETYMGNIAATGHGGNFCAFKAKRGEWKDKWVWSPTVYLLDTSSSWFTQPWPTNERGPVVGQIHGKMLYKALGTGNAYPRGQGYIVTGFSVDKQGNPRFNSASSNQHGLFNDGNQAGSTYEQSIIRQAVNAWKNRQTSFVWGVDVRRGRHFQLGRRLADMQSKED